MQVLVEKRRKKTAAYIAAGTPEEKDRVRTQRKKIFKQIKERIFFSILSELI